MTTTTSADLIERIALRYGALPEEIEEAKKYKPSFVELATLPALGKRSYYRPSSLRAHRLQAVLVEEYLLMRYSQKENSAFFINIATLSSLEQAVIRKVMIEHTSNEILTFCIYVLRRRVTRGVFLVRRRWWPDRARDRARHPRS